MRSTVLLILLCWASNVLANDMQHAAQIEISQLEEVLAKNPSDGFAHYQLGLLYRELGDNRRATTNLQSAISYGFVNLGARMHLIEAAFACGQSTLALQTAKLVLTPAVKSPAILLRVGNLLFDHLFYKDALWAFQLAHESTPNAFEPQFRIALTYYLMQDYAAAIATMKALEDVILNPEAASLLASAEAETGHLETALSILRSAIRASPGSPHPYINLALIELDHGNSVGAEEVLDQFRTLKTKTDAKVFYRAIRNSCHEMAEAVAGGKGAFHPSADKADFYYQLALQLQEHFNFLSASELIRMAQASEGNSARVLLVAGTSCLNQDPLAAEPVLFLREAIAKNPNLHKAYYLLGRALTRQGKLEEAVAAYRKAAELHPDASYLVALGKALGTQEAALMEFRRALALDASYAEAHMELGRVYLRLEQFDEARQELEKAVELEPDFYEADYLLGRLLHRIGDEQQSHKQLLLFTEKKNALMQQSVIGAGYVGDGR